MADKLPIPRLRRERRESSRQRTDRACDSCRQRKSKCDGNKPTCSHCFAQGLNNCTYSDAKVVRQQKDFESAQRKVERYEELLREISPELERPTANRVAKALRSQHSEPHEHQDRPSSASSSSSIGSLDAVDVVKEDLNRSEKSRATGHMGKNSEVTWMQRLDSESSKRNDGGVPATTTARHQLPIDDSIASMNYRLDYQTVSDPAVANPFVLPPKPLADRLFQIYLEKVHVSLPLIRQDLFVAQYSRCYSERHVNPGRKWLAVFNMIFAIGCAVWRLSGREIQHGADENIFLARAKCLNLSETILYGHDDLQQVQAETLMALYFLIVSQVNRSWKMIGIAARSGIALGLNLQKRTIANDARSDDVRKQLWWSIFLLENLLTTMTGRASCLGGTSCSVSPPLSFPGLESEGLGIHHPIQEGLWTMQMGKREMDTRRNFLKSLTPSASLYFFYLVDLSLIVHSITNEVYSIDSSRAGWSQVESRIASHHKKMDYWISTLHPSFCFQDSHGNPLSGIRSPFRNSLALNYYSAQIVLNRPCLNSHALTKETGSEPSRSRIGNVTALNCLRASLAVMALLPDQPDLAWCYEVPQWWDLLHVLTQATVILLLDISIGPVPTSVGEDAVPVESADLIWSRARKGLSWMHCLGRTSEAARRAFQFFKSCAHRIAPTKGLDVSGIPSAFGSSQTSRDPELPWLRDSAEEKTVPLQQETQASHDQGYPQAADRNNPSLHGDNYDDVPFQAPLRRVPNASAMLDADIDMAELISHPDADVEEVLLSIVVCNR